ncbi:hypothetical protein ACJX0J_023102 [Zea mays]
MSEYLITFLKGWTHNKKNLDMSKFTEFLRNVSLKNLDMSKFTEFLRNVLKLIVFFFGGNTKRNTLGELKQQGTATEIIGFCLEEDRPEAAAAAVFFFQQSSCCLFFFLAYLFYMYPKTDSNCCFSVPVKGKMTLIFDTPEEITFTFIESHAPIHLEHYLYQSNKTVKRAAGTRRPSLCVALIYCKLEGNVFFLLLVHGLTCCIRTSGGRNSPMEATRLEIHKQQRPSADYLPGEIILMQSCVWHAAQAMYINNNKHVCMLNFVSRSCLNIIAYSISIRITRKTCHNENVFLVSLRFCLRTFFVILMTLFQFYHYCHYIKLFGTKAQKP